jgi:hypothetical protein
MAYREVARQTIIGGIRKDQVSAGIEKARLADKSEIELLKNKLEQAELVVQNG